MPSVIEKRLIARQKRLEAKQKAVQEAGKEILRSRGAPNLPPETANQGPSRSQQSRSAIQSGIPDQNVRLPVAGGGTRPDLAPPYNPTSGDTYEQQQAFLPRNEQLRRRSDPNEVAGRVNPLPITHIKRGVRAAGDSVSNFAAARRGGSANEAYDFTDKFFDTAKNVGGFIVDRFDAAGNAIAETVDGLRGRGEPGSAEQARQSLIAQEGQGGNPPGTVRIDQLNDTSLPDNSQNGAQVLEEGSGETTVGGAKVYQNKDGSFSDTPRGEGSVVHQPGAFVGGANDASARENLLRRTPSLGEGSGLGSFVGAAGRRIGANFEHLDQEKSPYFNPQLNGGAVVRSRFPEGQSPQDIYASQVQSANRINARTATRNAGRLSGTADGGADMQRTLRELQSNASTAYRRTLGRGKNSKAAARAANVFNEQANQLVGADSNNVRRERISADQDYRSASLGLRREEFGGLQDYRQGSLENDRLGLRAGTAAAGAKQLDADLDSVAESMVPLGTEPGDRKTVAAKMRTRIQSGLAPNYGTLGKQADGEMMQRARADAGLLEELSRHAGFDYYSINDLKSPDGGKLDQQDLRFWRSFFNDGPWDAIVRDLSGTNELQLPGTNKWVSVPELKSMRNLNRQRQKELLNEPTD